MKNDIPVLRNKLGIRDQVLLDDAEADYVVYRLKDLALNLLAGDYHTEHLLRMHEYIFGDLFEWAGVPRTISIYKEDTSFQRGKYQNHHHVLLSAYLSDGTDFSKKEYLRKIVYDALRQRPGSIS